MTPIILAGSLSMQDLIKSQGGGLAEGGGVWNWAFFHSPFVALSFFIFFIAQLAEGNRTPFDLPEAESELVSGYNTEYSGMRFLMFFLGEFANVWILCALPVVLYFGGWQIPFGTLADGATPAPWVVNASPYILSVMMAGAAIPALMIGLAIWKYRTNATNAINKAQIPGLWPAQTRLVLKLGLWALMLGHIAGAVGLVGGAFGHLKIEHALFLEWRQVIAINGLQLGIFVAKTAVLVFIVIQLRWTLPRIRIDQMMTLCWKYLVPLSFVCVIGTLVWELTIAKIGVAATGVRILMMLASIAIVAMYIKRIKFNYEETREHYEGYRGVPQYFPPWRLP